MNVPIFLFDKPEGSDKLRIYQYFKEELDLLSEVDIVSNPLLNGDSGYTGLELTLNNAAKEIVRNEEFRVDSSEKYLIFIPSDEILLCDKITDKVYTLFSENFEETNRILKKEGVGFIGYDIYILLGKKEGKCRVWPVKNPAYVEPGSKKN